MLTIALTYGVCYPLAMRESDIAYMAGFFDGEGYIGFTTNPITRLTAKYGMRTSYSHCIQVRIVNTNLKVLKRLNKLWGGFIYSRKVTKKRQTPTYDLILTSKTDIINFINKIYPYLVVKKEQIDKALTSFEIASGRKYVE